MKINALAALLLLLLAFVTARSAGVQEDTKIPTDQENPCNICPNGATVADEFAPYERS
jgi:hypothetical protein